MLDNILTFPLSLFIKHSRTTVFMYLKIMFPNVSHTNRIREKEKDVEQFAELKRIFFNSSFALIKTKI